MLMGGESETLRCEVDEDKKGKNQLTLSDDN